MQGYTLQGNAKTQVFLGTFVAGNKSKEIYLKGFESVLKENQKFTGLPING